MGSFSVSKGKRLERVWARALNAVGIKSERNLGEVRSEALGVDVIAECGSTLVMIQVKNRKSPSVWKALAEAEEAVREMTSVEAESLEEGRYSRFDLLMPIALIKRTNDRTMVVMPPFVALALLQAWKYGGNMGMVFQAQQTCVQERLR